MLLSAENTRSNNGWIHLSLWRHVNSLLKALIWLLYCTSLFRIQTFLFQMTSFSCSYTDWFVGCYQNPKSKSIECLVFMHVVFRWMCVRKLLRNWMKYWWEFFFFDFWLRLHFNVKKRGYQRFCCCCYCYYLQPFKLNKNEKKNSIIFAYHSFASRIPFPLIRLRRFHNSNKTNQICEMHSGMSLLSIEHKHTLTYLLARKSRFDCVYCACHLPTMC